ncbi:MAG: efflux RND transporter periplasmic adaptor subunit [Hyphomicrobiales bacterium]|nr:MAG: efflux RND transporter periplasmic adaptor subunit [Hyphomicrobiales bacterium]
MTAENTDALKSEIEAVLPSGGKPGRGIFRRILRWLLILIVLGGAGAAYWMYSGKESAVTYVTSPVTSGNMTVLVTATGSVEPTNQVDVSSELSGTVKAVHVDYNSVVAQGELLAELTTEKLQASVDSSRAKLAAAEAKVADAKVTLIEKEREYARKRGLSERKVGTEQDLDTAKAAYERAVVAVKSAEADVGIAKASLELDETNLAKSKIYSPIKGVILERSVDPGQTIAASLSAPVLFSIAEDLTKMELQVDVDEADVGRVSVGQKATFYVDAYPDQRFPAEIREIYFASEVVQSVVTYKAILDIDNSALLLRPGMTATAEIRVKEVENALLVPNTALRYAPPVAEEKDTRSFLERMLPGPPRFRRASKQETEPDGTGRKVWVLRDGAPESVPVEVGASDGRRTEIVGGELTEGDRVITSQRTAKK